MGVDDRKLETLIAVAEEGSFNKAAARCHCSQSAVTQAVNSIEAELGCSVFERSHAGARLTDAGRALVPLAREALDALVRLQQTAGDLSRRDAHVRIGAYPSVVQSWLPGAISAYGRLDPSTTFDMRIGSDDLAGLLREGCIDLALCDDWLFEDAFSKPGGGDYRASGHAEESKMAWLPLAVDPFCAVVPKGGRSKTGDTITRDQLFEQPFVFCPKYVYARYLSSEVSSIVKVEADDSASIASMVANGMGVSVLPQLCLRAVPEGVSVLKLDPPGQRTIGVAYAPRAPKAVHSFIGFLRGYVCQG